jgi:nicotinamidase-related amidase
MARDAADRGFFTTLATDACGASGAGAHAQAVERLRGGGIAGLDVGRLIALSGSLEGR